MELHDMLNILQQRSGRQLSQEQLDVVTHETGPLWVIAGPGSGKTEVLVIRCLKLACVDLVPPKAIILTTFTEKAAKNIQDRLAVYKGHLDQEDLSLRPIDLFQIRVGTLHSLCNDIMQEYRYAGYQNYRLLDEIDQLLFVYEHSELAASNPPQHVHLPLWRSFAYLVSRFSRVTQYRWTPGQSYLPHRWLRANATKVLFNRIVEDRVSVNQLQGQGGVLANLGGAYQSYLNSLETNLCCDFAHLQLKFLDFLSSPSGAWFLNGDGSAEHPGVQHVLVDEYQDTNLIQEELYLRLAQREPYNLCVVGDDDQALYRFRGGTVECMVNFDQACQRAFGEGVEVTPRPLSTNYRSHPQIVNWCDEYIRSFTVMTLEGARVANKPNLTADPDWFTKRQDEGAVIGNYPSVSFLVGQDDQQLANNFGNAVQGLLAGGIITDPSQCVLLIKSTQDRAAGLYQAALQSRNIPVYNPRSRSMLSQIEIRAALGALVAILDPNRAGVAQVRARGIQNMINDWVAAYTQVAQNNPMLADYINRATNRIRQIAANQTVTQMATQPTTFPATLQEIYYHIISFEPFATWEQDPEQTVRMGSLSKVLESYCSVPFPGHFGSTRGTLRTDRNIAGQVNAGQLNHFYYALVGLLVSEGLNDPEDEEVICPPGRFPIMTVHQAKGLEFPVVFVAKTGVQNAPVGAELELEDALQPFRDPATPAAFTAQQRAEQDYIRFYYVAYSRAQYALILLSLSREVTRQGLGFGGYGRHWFEQRVQRLN
jgi:DNA helicase-2/ATP-dependent DNA helicase PcrA